MANIYRYRTDFIEIDRLIQLYPELELEGNELADVLTEFNTAVDGDHTCHTTSITRENSSILDADELRNLIKSRQQGSLTFWNSPTRFDIAFSNYLLLHLDTDVLYELMPERMPFSKPPGEDPVANLVDYFDTMITALTELRDKGLVATDAIDGYSREPIYERVPQVWENYNRRFAKLDFDAVEYDSLRGTYSDYEFVTAPVIQPFTLDPGLSVSFPLREFIENRSPINFEYEISYAESELFLDLILSGAENRFEIEMLLAKAYCEAKKGRPPREAELFAWGERLTPQSLTEMIEFFQRMKEIVAQGSVTLGPPERPAFDPILVPSEKVRQFIEGPVFAYLHASSIGGAELDPRTVKAREDLRAARASLEIPWEESYPFALLEKEPPRVGEFLRCFDYSVEAITFSNEKKGTSLSISFPVKLVASQAYQGLLNYDSQSYERWEPVSSPSWDLIGELTKDPNWKIQGEFWDLALKGVVPYGGMTINQIKADRKHPLHPLLPYTKKTSASHADSVFNKFLADFKDHHWLILNSLEFEPDSSQLTRNDVNDRMERSVHYALWHSEDPLLCLIVLWEQYLSTRDEGLARALKAIFVQMDVVIRQSSFSKKEKGVEEITVEHESRDLATRWGQLEDYETDVLVERLSRALKGDKDAIPKALNSLYYQRDHEMIGEGEIFYIHRDIGLADEEVDDPQAPSKRRYRRALKGLQEGLPLRRFQFWRHRWHELNQELKEADQNHNRYLDAEEFLSGEMSQPVESFIENFLQEHPARLEKLVSLENPDAREALLRRLDLGENYLDQNPNKQHPELLEPYRNLSLLPVETLARMLTFSDNLTLRQQLWIVLSHKDRDRARDLWLVAVGAWLDEGTFYGHNVSEIDVLVPLSFLDNLDPLIADLIPKINEKYFLAHPQYKDSPDAILFKVLWSGSDEPLPWDLLADYFRRIYDVAYERLRRHQEEKQERLRRGGLGSFGSPMGVSVPFAVEEAQIKIDMLLTVHNFLASVLQVMPNLDPEEARRGLQKMTVLEPWQRDLVLFLVFDRRSPPLEQPLPQSLDQAFREITILTTADPSFSPLADNSAVLLFKAVEDYTGLPNEEWLYAEMPPAGGFALSYADYQNFLDLLLNLPISRHVALRTLWAYRGDAEADVRLEKLISTTEGRASFVRTILGLSKEQQAEGITWLSKRMSWEDILAAILDSTRPEKSDSLGFISGPNFLRIFPVLETVLKHFDVNNVEVLTHLRDVTWSSQPWLYRRNALAAVYLSLLSFNREAAREFLKLCAVVELHAEKKPNRDLERIFVRSYLQGLSIDAFKDDLITFLQSPIGRVPEGYSYFELLLGPQMTFARLGNDSLLFFDDANADDQAGVPESIYDNDTSRLSGQEIQGLGGYFERYHRNQEMFDDAVWDYMGAVRDGRIEESEIEAVRRWALAEKNRETPSRLYPWSMTLLAAVSGDDESLKALWQFYFSREEQEKLEGSLHPLESRSALSFRSPYRSLVSLIEFVLIRDNPERFFMATEMPTVDSDSKPAAIVMIENGYVDPQTPGIGEVEYVGTEDPAENISHHATSVAQVLFGNTSRRQEKPAGMIINYALDYEENIWPQLADTLENIWERVQQGEEIAVINFSAGEDSGLISRALMAEHRNNVDFQRCQRALAGLNTKGVVLVLAFGNSGTALPAGFSAFGLPLGNGNRLSLLGNNVFLVGSYEFKVRSADNKEAISSFSSRGGVFASPDVLAPGADWNLWYGEGDGFAKEDGTSFSAPFSAKIIERIRAINPSLTGDQIQAILNITAEDIGSHYSEDQGSGRLQANRSFFIAWFLTGGWHGPKKINEKALEFGVEHEYKELVWMARRLRE